LNDLFRDVFSVMTGKEDVFRSIYRDIFVIWLPISNLNIKLCSNYVQNYSSTSKKSEFWINKKPASLTGC